MLVLSNAIDGKKVMSIHAGGAIATISGAVINPDKLKIEAFAVQAKGLKYFSVVHSSDIREWSRLGVIINSEDNIMEVDDGIPRTKKLVEADFKLDGIGVRTESGKRLGRVRNYVFETEGFFVVKFYIEKSGILTLLSQPLIIERDSIVNVTDKYLVVADDLQTVKVEGKLEEDSPEAAVDMAT